MNELKLLEAAKARRDRHGNIVLTLDLFISILQEATNPSAYSYQPPPTPPQLKVPSEYPKRLVRVGENREPVEERIVYDHAELQALRRAGGNWYPMPIEE
jgi:hypothetical protein